jgi:hypothetical protein
MAWSDEYGNARQAHSTRQGAYYTNTAANSTPIWVDLSKEMQNKIDLLTFALGQVTGIVLLHKLDIEDEAYEVIMEELNEIVNDVMSKL